MRYDGIVIGGGAAGMFAAITAAKRGQNVLLLEKEEKKNPELDEKMAQGAADFLGRQMG